MSNTQIYIIGFFVLYFIVKLYEVYENTESTWTDVLQKAIFCLVWPLSGLVFIICLLLNWIKTIFPNPPKWL